MMQGGGSSGSNPGTPPSGLNGDNSLERPPSENGSLTSESSSTPPLYRQDPSPLVPPAAPMSLASMLHPTMRGGPPPTGGIFNNPFSGLHQPAQPLLSPSMSFANQPMLLTDMLRDKIPDDVWRDYLLHFENGEGCGFQGCEMEEVEHFHCKDDGCETVFRSEEGVREHGRNHFVQDHVTDKFFYKSDPEDNEENGSGNSKDPKDLAKAASCGEACPHRIGQITHFHCQWVSCLEAVWKFSSFCLWRNFFRRRKGHYSGV